MKNKKGIQLSQAFGAVLTLVLVAILVIIAIYIFSALLVSFPNVSVTVVNETGWLNQSGYLLSNSTACGFISPAITGLFNATSGTAVNIANATINSTTYRVFNTSAITYPNASITYTYQWEGPACSAATSTITQFGTYPALVGLVGTIIFLALVIGVLVASFAFGGKRGV